MTDFSIPKFQNAAVRTGEGDDARAPLKKIDVDLPGPDEVLVKINWTGLCSSDDALIHGGWHGVGVDMQPETKGIAGHEGAGVVVSVGDNMHHKWKVGDRAGVKWVRSICGMCELCTNGTDELHCPNQKISAVTVPGTFQQYVVADGNYTTRLPEGVEDEEAGPIMCAGVTAYTACKRSSVRPGQWIVVQGAGGGLGQFAVQYAKVMGMRIIAIDRGDQKRELCQRLGAEEFIDRTLSEDIPAEVKRITKYGAQAVLVLPPSKEAYALAPNLVRPGGTVVVVGLPHDESVIAGATPKQMVLDRLSFVGSVTGTLKDVDEALDFTARGLVHPILTKGTLAEVDKYLELMHQGQLAGRVVLKVAQNMNGKRS
ncbi:hypothetical protein LTR96_000411 [Exophiala xenobiotica]|nr:hypothetical protein H2202_007698 [Exophiala xenobiotica]KAK5273811.1 hypothetical protein LTR96_000411 [Exophiala xenobiotica]KAK5337971.1 hypothetical protein LTR98_005820 [Exophiala xenobiotica]KAK5418474.1 hypothetical protein LTR06_002224 [Exophiala xenobiotica]